MMDNFCEDLTTRMEKMEEAELQRKRRIQKEYNESKQSPTFYKNQALEKLDKIIKECNTHDDFKLHIFANNQIFSEDERIQIQSQLDTYLENESRFNVKKKELMNNNQNQ